MKKIKIAIVEDHTMVSKAIENMLNENKNFEVMMNDNNGEIFLENLEAQDKVPDIVLMDVNMPLKDGVETTTYLTEHFPDIKVIALTMEDSEKSIIKMLQAGAKGYLLKDMQPDILFQAITTVYNQGVFYTDMVTQTLLKLNKYGGSHSLIDELKDREKEFIKWACSELTYKEIADKMFLSPKTIDGYRESVFRKLEVKNRVGLVLFAIKNGLTDNEK